MATVSHNLPDFYRQLRNVDKRVRTRAVRRATSAAGAVLRRFARSAAPVRTGTLKRAVYLSRLRNRRRDEVGYSVRVRSGGKSKRSDGYYGRWVIKGHLVRGPGGRIRGGKNAASLARRRLRAGGAKVVPPNPFLDRAFSAGKYAALTRFNRRMSVEIAKINATT